MRPDTARRLRVCWSGTLSDPAVFKIIVFSEVTERIIIQKEQSFGAVPFFDLWYNAFGKTHHEIKDQWGISHEKKRYQKDF